MTCTQGNFVYVEFYIRLWLKSLFIEMFLFNAKFLQYFSLLINDEQFSRNLFVNKFIRVDRLRQFIFCLKLRRIHTNQSTLNFLSRTRSHFSQRTCSYQICFGFNLRINSVPFLRCAQHSLVLVVLSYADSNQIFHNKPIK